MADIAASFQQAIIEVLTEKTINAAKNYKISSIAIAGGVSANSGLREMLLKRCEQEKIKLFLPPFSLCTDNAAMIAAAAHYKISNKKIPLQTKCKASANLSL